MARDHGLAARVNAALARLGERGVRQKNACRGRGALAGKKATMMVGREGLDPNAPVHRLRGGGLGR